MAKLKITMTGPAGTPDDEMDAPAGQKNGYSKLKKALGKSKMGRGKTMQLGDEKD